MQLFTILMDAKKLSNTMRIKEHGPLVDKFVFFHRCGFAIAMLYFQRMQRVYSKINLNPLPNLPIGSANLSSLDSSAPPCKRMLAHG